MLMKKIFTLSLFLLATVWSMAQDSNTFQFVDKDGNVVAGGTTITRSELVDDPFGENYISTGLHVKNTSDGSVNMRVAYQIETMDNGRPFANTQRTKASRLSGRKSSATPSVHNKTALHSSWAIAVTCHCAVLVSAESAAV